MADANTTRDAFKQLRQAASNLWKLQAVALAGAALSEQLDQGETTELTRIFAAIADASSEYAIAINAEEVTA